MIDGLSIRSLRPIARQLTGVAVCVAAGFLLWRGLAFQTESNSTVLARSWKHLSTNELLVHAAFPEQSDLRIGCRVLVETSHGLRMIGSLEEVQAAGGQQEARFLIFPDKRHLLHTDSRLVAHRTASNVAWVVQTLLPPEHIESIKQRLLVTWQDERSRLWEELKPGLFQLLTELGSALKEEFPALLAEHSAEVETIGDVLREKAWVEHLEPVFVETVWPIMEERASPVIRSVGDEIIAEAPVWSLYWAYLRQKVSSDKDANHLEKKVGEFLSEKAVPIIRRHSPEFRKTLSALLFDVVKNGSVQRALEASVTHSASDPRFRDALSVILEKWIIESPRVQSLLKGALTRPNVKQPLAHIVDRFERDIHNIANLILLNETHDGINPDLARVLRNRLLREDESWVLLIPGEGEAWRDEELIGEDGGTR